MPCVRKQHTTAWMIRFDWTRSETEGAASGCRLASSVAQRKAAAPVTRHWKPAIKFYGDASKRLAFPMLWQAGPWRAGVDPQQEGTTEVPEGVWETVN